MIVEARMNDVEAIIKLWKLAYPNVNEKILEYRAKKIFEEGSCLTYYQDDKMVSSIQMKNLYLSFKDLILSSADLTTLFILL